MPTCNQQKRLLLLWLSCRSRRVQLADVVKNVFLIRKGLISIINLMASINQKIKNETDDFIPMINLPIEIKLDILKCLDFSQLTTLQQTNSQICKLIKRYANELARKKFSTLTIDSDNDGFSVPMRRYPITTAIFDFKPSTELEEKWEVALKNKTPMYFYLNDYKNVYVLAKSNSCYFRFELFRCPTSIDQLLYARHCLEQLSYCFFDEIIFERIVFNPKMIKLLFDDQPIKFQCNITKLLLYKGDYDNQALEVVKDNLVISDMLSFRFIWVAFTSLYDVDEYIFLNFLLNGGAKIPLASIYYIDSAIELHNEVIKFAETSMDCSKMVNSIEFQRLKWVMPKFSSRVKLIKQKEYIKAGNPHITIKYETTNLYNSNLVFLINIWKEVSSESIQRFKIQKTTRFY